LTRIGEEQGMGKKIMVKNNVKSAEYITRCFSLHTSTAESRKLFPIFFTSEASSLATTGTK
jgi:hypothetical protein